jgi:hypothetical protein
MGVLSHEIKNGGVGVANWANPINNTSTAVTSRPYIKTLVIPLARVASAGAQTITAASITGWPTGYISVIDSALNVIAAEATGATKTISVGYTGATTAFLNGQTCAATGFFGGARPTANIQAKDIIYTLGSNDWAEAVLELVLTFVANGDPA